MHCSESGVNLLLIFFKEDTAGVPPLCSELNIESVATEKSIEISPVRSRPALHGRPSSNCCSPLQLIFLNPFTKIKSSQCCLQALYITDFQGLRFACHLITSHGIQQQVYQPKFCYMEMYIASRSLVLACYWTGSANQKKQSHTWKLLYVIVTTQSQSQDVTLGLVLFQQISEQKVKPFLKQGCLYEAGSKTSETVSVVNLQANMALHSNVHVTGPSNNFHQ